MQTTTPPGSEVGFGLLEALVVLAIAALLAQAVATPLHQWMQHLTGLQRMQALVQDLWLARQEAIRHGTLAVLCVSPNAQHCATQGPWHHGWMLFIDHNRNAFWDEGEPVVMRHAGYQDGWTLTGNQPVQRHVSYAPTGYTRTPTGALQIGTFTLCPPPGSPYVGRQVVINSMGRPRSQQAPTGSCS